MGPKTKGDEKLTRIVNRRLLYWQQLEPQVISFERRYSHGRKAFQTNKSVISIASYPNNL
jgi:hypothetical protein